MRQATLLSSLLLSSILYADAQGDDCCGMGPRPMRVTARHIEANGVGYNQGYTTIEGFFSPTRRNRDEWLPFLDLRGHVFNDGKWAANAGAGLRYITPSRVWGGNVYYDYRDTKHQHYNQAGLGFESLGEEWDFRINGYIPVGTKISSHYHPRFDKFAGHSLFIKRTREFALGGVNAEAGWHMNTYKDAPLYLAAGPYYLEGRGKNVWGGELRAALDIGNYLRLEGNVSYDSLFNWIGQGQVSVIVPFGAKRGVRKHCNSCCTALALSERALQRVDRNEIIPVSHKHKVTQITTSNFIFVDSNSHSDGTWESPYPTLMQAEANSAPNDIIYVLPGNGNPYDVTSTSGLTMKSGQNLWGSSTPHQLSTPFGIITIPPLSTAIPSVTLTNGFPIVTMGINGEVAGMEFVGSNTAGAILFNFVESGSGSLSIINNQISAGAPANLNVITVINSGAGTFTPTISNNQISNITISGTLVGINIDNTASGIISATIANNQLANLSSDTAISGIFLTTTTTGTLNASVIGNQLADFSCTSHPTPNVTGINAVSNNNGILNLSIANNRLANFTAVGGGGFCDGINVSSAFTSVSTIINNSIANLTNDGPVNGIATSQAANANGTTVISNNQIANLTSNGSFNTFGIFNLSSSGSFSINYNQVANIAGGINGQGIRAINSTGSSLYTILGNQTANISSVGISVTNTGIMGSTCLVLSNNNAEPEILLRATAGTLTLDTSSGNNIPAPVEVNVTNASCAP